MKANWDISSGQRDLEWETDWGFDASLDYDEEIRVFNALCDKYNSTHDAEAYEELANIRIKHNGGISFGLKWIYYKQCKRAGLL